VSLSIVIIRAELLPKNEKIQNKMSLSLTWVSPSSRILMDVLDFHTKK